MTQPPEHDKPPLSIQEHIFDTDTQQQLSPHLAVPASSSSNHQPGGHSGHPTPAAMLTADVLAHVVALLSADKADIRAFRCTCRAWRAAADMAVRTVRLRAPRICQTILQFPSLLELDLAECSHLRNSHVEALAGSMVGGRLRSLALGNVHIPHAGKIKLSNQAMTYIASMTSLRHISLCNCWAITDRGITQLSSLHHLTSLAILDCPRITDHGLSFLPHLASLQNLSLSGVKVTNATLQSLTTLSLARLHLCCIGATPPCLSTTLAAMPHCTHVLLSWMQLSTDVLDTLRSMTQLRALQLLECRGCNSSDMITAAASLCQLTKLHLHNAEGIVGSDVEQRIQHVIQHVPHIRNFSCVGVYGPSIQPMLGHLATLSNLVHLRLGAPTGRWASQLTALSALTTLTALQVKCAHFNYAGYWAGVLRTLPSLVSLDLSHNWTGHPTSPLFPPSWCLVTNGLVRAIVACSGLRRVDLSFTHANDEQLWALVRGLPGLRELVLHGMPVGGGTLAAVEREAPRLFVAGSGGGWGGCVVVEEGVGGRGGRRRGGRGKRGGGGGGGTAVSSVKTIERVVERAGEEVEP